MAAQFDARLNRILSVDGSTYKNVPFTYYGDTNILSEVPHPDTILAANTQGADGQDDPSIEDNNKHVADRAARLISTYNSEGDYSVVPSIMNPYTMVRLYGAKHGQYLVDSSTTRKYYEIDGDERGGYAKNPSTAALIQWGNGDKYSRTPYQFQDFVFCKYWNKIPNNRMITLRRYPNPILDNLNFPTMDGDEDKKQKYMHPIATCVTYFGGDTDNKISDILEFTTGLNWEEIESDVWTVGSQSEGMDETLSMFGGNSWISQHSRALVDIMGILNPDQFNPSAADGLPPDPYSNGPYENRVIGPVNVINKVQKRKRGLQFAMDGLTIKFHYVARPIGGINAKAALLDCLGNILTMSSASAQFFGGAHKFMVQPNRYPFNNSSFFKKMYNGQLLSIKNKDGSKTVGAAEELANNFTSRFAHENALGYKIGDIGKTLLSAMTDILGDAWNMISNAFNSVMSGGSPFESTQQTGQSAATTAITRVLGNEMRTNIGQVPYLTGLRSIFTGEPVGDWHLTIGNPMNPIAMIGNLVCDNVKVKFDDELGPDDFPIGFTAEITLKHGMPRDRDAIESIFNRGAGRIYEISDEMQTSADHQTAVDEVTKQMKYKGNGGLYERGSVIDGRGSAGGGLIRDLTIREGYKSSGTTLKISGMGNGNDDLNTIESLGGDGKGWSNHILAPWAIKNIM